MKPENCAPQLASVRHRLVRCCLGAEAPQAKERDSAETICQSLAISRQATALLTGMLPTTPVFQSPIPLFCQLKGDVDIQYTYPIWKITMPTGTLLRQRQTSQPKAVDVEPAPIHKNNQTPRRNPDTTHDRNGLQLSSNHGLYVSSPP